MQDDIGQKLLEARLVDESAIAKAQQQQKNVGGSITSNLVKIGAIAGLSSVMLVLLYGQTRIFYTMSRDGLIPPVFARVHPRFKTPWINTILVGVPSPSSSTSDVRGIRIIARVDEGSSLNWQYTTVPFGTPIFEFGDASRTSEK